VPPTPALNPPSWDDLLFVVGYLPEAERVRYEAAIDRLDLYEVALVNYSLELRAGLRAACGAP
jgi:hypothetical protein